ncbi:hypothetical protein GCM10023074_70110 [Microbispora amethystogenes]|uniref:Uncharacterized protein n=1 Tax=Microbispora amethystogenes TaxID=1427754 RepID=A0ABQ4FPV6_9ACTN|nr:hypothetical protein Mam01_70180 [Microbispora amethystogenes]
MSGKMTHQGSATQRLAFLLGKTAQGILARGLIFVSTPKGAQSHQDRIYPDDEYRDVACHASQAPVSTRWSSGPQPPYEWTPSPGISGRQEAADTLLPCTAQEET